MKIYTFKPEQHRSSSRQRGATDDLPPLAPGVSWVRFGNETLLYSEDDVESEGASPPSRGARVPRRHTTATPDQLYVVVQHGRRFQQHHPDIPVLHDRGRFLLVELTPEQLQQVKDTSAMCYAVMPLTPGLVVFEERPRVSGRARNPTVTALINKLDLEKIKTTLDALTAFETRHSTSPQFGEAAGFAKQELDAMGYLTSMQSVSMGSRTSSNVIADKTGAGPSPRNVVIVTAHLDSINVGAGPAGRAPGADDNASGSTGVLEIARALKDHVGRHDLRFILFGGEEQGLVGSRHYVTSLSGQERAAVSAVINMDMIGSRNGPVASVLLEGATVSQSIIDGLADAAATYTALTVETSLNPFNSDHVPFIDRGIPAVLTIEGADNTNDTVHSAADTRDRIDHAFLHDILKMNVAFVAGAIG